MGRTYEVIDQGLAEWLEAQPVFFVSTAPLSADGLVNCSPKGNRDEFVVVDERTVAYLDQTGSGVETIAHLRENGRIVVMFCAFAGAPRIVRLHGRGRAVLTDDPGFADLAGRFPGGRGVGVRSIIVVDVSRIADSCGYGVPFMSFEGHRPTHGPMVEPEGPRGHPEVLGREERQELDQLDGLTINTAR